MTNIPGVALAFAAMAPLLACGGTAGKSAGQSTTNPGSGTPPNVGVLTVDVAAGKGSVRIDGPASTTTCNDHCEILVDEASNVRLSANSDAGWVLDSWSGACSGWHECAIQITGQETVTARFKPAPQPAKTPSYDALDLSRLDGPNAVTDALVLDDVTGAVAGRICDGPPLCSSMKWDVFLWDGTLQRFRVENGVQALVAATAAGRVAGTLLKADGSRRAFISAGNGLVELPTLGGDSFARAMNASGVVVGASAASPGELHAVAWNGGSITDLGVRTGMVQSDAMAVDENGNVGVVACGTSPVCRVMMVTDSSVLDLGTVPEGLSPSAMNVAGTVVGSLQGAGQWSHAAAWTGGQISDLDREITALPWPALGARPDNQLGSWLAAVNAAGDAVGDVNIALSEGAAATAILWKDGTIYDLASGVEPRVPLHTAFAINAKGQVLATTASAGYGRVLLTPR
jgi:probable HAF family extracellular repeat protein